MNKIMDSLPEKVLGKLLVIRENAENMPIPQVEVKVVQHHQSENQFVQEARGEKMANKPLTAVLVDYENWYWGLQKLYKGARPDVQSFFNMVQDRGEVKQIKFFGDFTKQGIREERMKLRAISNNIIDCANDSTSKDYTDFIMLDQIYDIVMDNPEIKQIILFTGDGHFHNVVSSLRHKRGKTVGVYALKGTLNHNLKMSVNWWEELSPLMAPVKAPQPVPAPKPVPAPVPVAPKLVAKQEPEPPQVDPRDIEQMIIEQIFKMEEQGKFPSYLRTVEHLVNVLKVKYETIAVVASEMLSDGIIFRKPKEFSRQGVPGKAYILEINWEKWGERLVERELEKQTASS